MTAPAKPPVVHVYRVADGIVCFVSPYDGNATYLGPYVPKAKLGAIIEDRYEVSWWHDCSGEWQLDGEWHVSEDKRARAKAHEMFRRKKKEWPEAKYRIVHVVRRRKVRM